MYYTYKARRTHQLAASLTAPTIALLLRAEAYAVNLSPLSAAYMRQ